MSDLVRYLIERVEIDGPDLPDGVPFEITLMGTLHRRPGDPHRLRVQDWSGPRETDWRGRSVNAETT